jgi:hypothetical protein
MKRRSSPNRRQTGASESIPVQETARRRRKVLSKGTERASINRPATAGAAARASAADSDGLQRCGWAELYRGAASAEYIR